MSDPMHAGRDARAARINEYAARYAAGLNLFGPGERPADVQARGGDGYATCCHCGERIARARLPLARAMGWRTVYPYAGGPACVECPACARAWDDHYGGER